MSVVKIKSDSFKLWKAINPIIWMAIWYEVPEIISDLEALQPQRLYYKWGLRIVIIALKLALDKYTHRGYPDATQA